VRGNTALLGVYPNSISVGGFSAGGHIAAFILQRARGQGIEGICFCLMVVPVTDASSLGVNLEPALVEFHKLHNLVLVRFLMRSFQIHHIHRRSQITKLLF
jgi:acetyl esterase/lipase